MAGKSDKRRLNNWYNTVSSTNRDASVSVTLLYAVVGLMVPLSQFGFIFFIWNTTKESTM